MTRPIINLNKVQLQALPPAFSPPPGAAQRFGPMLARLGPLLGSDRLGATIIGLAPGKAAFPMHNHHANDELFLVLCGNGEMRVGDKRHPVAPFDLIACPAGGRDTAHQLINTGADELRYLAIGTNFAPDLIEYPDSGKFKAAGVFPGDDGAVYQAIAASNTPLGYWEGE